MTMPEPRSFEVRLRGYEILVAAEDASRALPVATALSEAGAAVSVVRGLEAARAKLMLTVFDAVVVVGREEDAAAAGEFVIDLRTALRPTFAVVVARADEMALIRECVTAGALQLLADSSPREELVDAVAACVRVTWRLRTNLPPLLGTKPVARRQPVHTPAAAPAVTAVASDTVCDAVGSFGETVRLSQRERAVLGLMAKGYRYQDIGDALHISARTVKMHAANLRKKARVTTRFELLQKMYAGA